MSTRRFLPLIPIAIFMTLIGFLAYRLELIGQGDAPDRVPSVMIGRPAPVFSLPPLLNGKPGLASDDLKGKVTLINVFASWCVPCQAEHSLLAEIKKSGIRLAGINYKNQPDDARAWLAKMGNPYDAIGADRDGSVAIDFGVYGVPESYLIDKQGVIRFKQTGPLTFEDIENKLLPLAKELSR